MAESGLIYDRITIAIRLGFFAAPASHPGARSDFRSQLDKLSGQIPFCEALLDRTIRIRQRKTARLLQARSFSLK